MGFFSKIITGISKKNGKNSDRRIKGYVQACENLYNLCVSMYPDKDPHEHLVIVLCTIWTKSGVFKEAEIDKPTQAREIVAYTLFPASLHRIGHVCLHTNLSWKTKNFHHASAQDFRNITKNTVQSQNQYGTQRGMARS